MAASLGGSAGESHLSRDDFNRLIHALNDEELDQLLNDSELDQSAKLEIVDQLEPSQLHGKKVKEDVGFQQGLRHLFSKNVQRQAPQERSAAHDIVMPSITVPSKTDEMHQAISNKAVKLLREEIRSLGQNVQESANTGALLEILEQARKSLAKPAASPVVKAERSVKDQTKKPSKFATFFKKYVPSVSTKNTAADYFAGKIKAKAELPEGEDVEQAKPFTIPLAATFTGLVEQAKKPTTFSDVSQQVIGMTLSDTVFDHVSKDVRRGDLFKGSGALNLGATSLEFQALGELLGINADGEVTKLDDLERRGISKDEIAKLKSYYDGLKKSSDINAAIGVLRSTEPPYPPERTEQIASIAEQIVDKGLKLRPPPEMGKPGESLYIDVGHLGNSARLGIMRNDKNQLEITLYEDSGQMEQRIQEGLLDKVLGSKPKSLSKMTLSFTVDNDTFNDGFKSIEKLLDRSLGASYAKDKSTFEGLKRQPGAQKAMDKFEREKWEKTLIAFGSIASDPANIQLSPSVHPKGHGQSYATRLRTNQFEVLGPALFLKLDRFMNEWAIDQLLRGAKGPPELLTDDVIAEIRATDQIILWPKDIATASDQLVIRKSLEDSPGLKANLTRAVELLNHNIENLSVDRRILTTLNDPDQLQLASYDEAVANIGTGQDKLAKLREVRIVTRKEHRGIFWRLRGKKYHTGLTDVSKVEIELQNGQRFEIDKKTYLRLLKELPDNPPNSERAQALLDPTIINNLLFLYQDKSQVESTAKLFSTVFEMQKSLMAKSSDISGIKDVEDNLNTQIQKIRSMLASESEKLKNIKDRIINLRKIEPSNPQHAVRLQIEIIHLRELAKASNSYIAILKEHDQNLSKLSHEFGPKKTQWESEVAKAFKDSDPRKLAKRFLSIKAELQNTKAATQTSIAKTDEAQAESYQAYRHSFKIQGIEAIKSYMQQVPEFAALFHVSKADTRPSKVKAKEPKPRSESVTGQLHSLSNSVIDRIASDYFEELIAQVAEDHEMTGKIKDFDKHFETMTTALVTALDPGKADNPRGIAKLVKEFDPKSPDWTSLTETWGHGLMSIWASHERDPKLFEGDSGMIVKNFKVWMHAHTGIELADLSSCGLTDEVILTIAQKYKVEFVARTTQTKAEFETESAKWSEQLKQKKVRPGTQDRPVKFSERLEKSRKDFAAKLKETPSQAVPPDAIKPQFPTPPPSFAAIPKIDFAKPRAEGELSVSTLQFLMANRIPRLESREPAAIKAYEVAAIAHLQKLIAKKDLENRKDNILAFANEMIANLSQLPTGTSLEDGTLKLLAQTLIGQHTDEGIIRSIDALMSNIDNRERSEFQLGMLNLCLLEARQRTPYQISEELWCIAEKWQRLALEPNPVTVRLLEGAARVKTVIPEPALMAEVRSIEKATTLKSSVGLEGDPRGEDLIDVVLYHNQNTNEGQNYRAMSDRFKARVGDQLLVHDFKKYFSTADPVALNHKLESIDGREYCERFLLEAFRKGSEADKAAIREWFDAALQVASATGTKETRVSTSIFLLQAKAKLGIAEAEEIQEVQTFIEEMIAEGHKGGPARLLGFSLMIRFKIDQLPAEQNGDKRDQLFADIACARLAYESLKAQISDETLAKSCKENSEFHREFLGAQADMRSIHEPLEAWISTLSEHASTALHDTLLAYQQNKWIDGEPIDFTRDDAITSHEVIGHAVLPRDQVWDIAHGIIYRKNTRTSPIPINIKTDPNVRALNLQNHPYARKGSAYVYSSKSAGGEQPIEQVIIQEVGGKVIIQRLMVPYGQKKPTMMQHLSEDQVKTLPTVIKERMGIVQYWMDSQKNIHCYGIEGNCVAVISPPDQLTTKSGIPPAVADEAFTIITKEPNIELYKHLTRLISHDEMVLTKDGGYRIPLLGMTVNKDGIIKGGPYDGMVVKHPGISAGLVIARQPTKDQERELQNIKKDLAQAQKDYEQYSKVIPKQGVDLVFKNKLTELSQKIKQLESRQAAIIGEQLVIHRNQINGKPGEPPSLFTYDISPKGDLKPTSKSAAFHLVNINMDKPDVAFKLLSAVSIDSPLSANELAEIIQLRAEFAKKASKTPKDNEVILMLDFMQLKHFQLAREQSLQIGKEFNTIEYEKVIAAITSDFTATPAMSRPASPEIQAICQEVETDLEKQIPAQFKVFKAAHIPKVEAPWIEIQNLSLDHVKDTPLEQMGLKDQLVFNWKAISLDPRQKETIQKMRWMAKQSLSATALEEVNAEVDGFFFENFGLFTNDSVIDLFRIKGEQTGVAGMKPEYVSELIGWLKKEKWIDETEQEGRTYFSLNREPDELAKIRLKTMLKESYFSEVQANQIISRLDRYFNQVVFNSGQHRLTKFSSEKVQNVVNTIAKEQRNHELAYLEAQTHLDDLMQETGLSKDEFRAAFVTDDYSKIISKLKGSDNDKAQKAAQLRNSMVRLFFHKTEHQNLENAKILLEKYLEADAYFKKYGVTHDELVHAFDNNDFATLKTKLRGDFNEEIVRENLRIVLDANDPTKQNEISDALKLLNNKRNYDLDVLMPSKEVEATMKDPKPTLKEISRRIEKYKQANEGNEPNEHDLTKIQTDPISIEEQVERVQEQRIARAFLVFEEEFGNRINIQQADIFRGLLLTDEFDLDKIHAAQARMGFGKTALVPIIILARTALGKLVVLTVPEPLLDKNTKDLGGRGIKTEFTRYQLPKDAAKRLEVLGLASDDLRRQLRKLEHIRDGINVSTQKPSTSKAFANQLSIFSDLRNDPQILADAAQKKAVDECCVLLEKIRDMEKLITLDELDETQHPNKSDVTFTVGTKKVISTNRIMPIEKIMDIIKANEGESRENKARILAEQLGFSNKQAWIDFVLNPSAQKPADLPAVNPKESFDQGTIVLLCRGILSESDKGLHEAIINQKPGTNYGIWFEKQTLADGRKVRKYDYRTLGGFPPVPLLLAVPYSATDTPQSIGTQFTNTTVSTIATLRYYQDPKTSIDDEPHLGYLLGIIRDKEISSLVDAQDPGSKVYKDLIEIANEQDDQLKHQKRTAFLEKMGKPENAEQNIAFRRLLGRCIVAKQVKFDPRKASCNRYEQGNPHDEWIAFSGTSGDTSSYFRTYKKDPAADGNLTIGIMSRANCQTVQTVDLAAIENNTAEVYTDLLLDQILSSATHKARALIDIGGLCKLENSRIAQKLFEKIKTKQIDGTPMFPTMKGVIFFDDVTRSEKVLQPKTGGGYEIVEYNKDEHGKASDDPGDYFTYYDQSCSRGKNIPQMKGAQALTTFDITITNNDWKQGLMRMRKLINPLSGQYFTTTCSQHARKVIKRDLEKLDPGIKNRDITGQDIALWLSLKDLESGSKDIPSIVTKEIQSVVNNALAFQRGHVTKAYKALKAPTTAQTEAYEKFLRTLNTISPFIEESEDDLDKQYGGTLTTKSKEDFLQGLMKTYILDPEQRPDQPKQARLDKVFEAMSDTMEVIGQKPSEDEIAQRKLPYTRLADQIIQKRRAQLPERIQETSQKSSTEFAQSEGQEASQIISHRIDTDQVQAQTHAFTAPVISIRAPIPPFTTLDRAYDPVKLDFVRDGKQTRPARAMSHIQDILKRDDSISCSPGFIKKQDAVSARGDDKPIIPVRFFLRENANGRIILVGQDEANLFKEKAGEYSGFSLFDIDDATTDGRIPASIAGDPGEITDDQRIQKLLFLGHKTKVEHLASLQEISAQLQDKIIAPPVNGETYSAELDPHIVLTEASAGTGDVLRFNKWGYRGTDPLKMDLRVSKSADAGTKGDITVQIGDKPVIIKANIQPRVQKHQGDKGVFQAVKKEIEAEKDLAAAELQKLEAELAKLQQTPRKTEQQILAEIAQAEKERNELITKAKTDLAELHNQDPSTIDLLNAKGNISENYAFLIQKKPIPIPETNFTQQDDHNFEVIFKQLNRGKTSEQIVMEALKENGFDKGKAKEAMMIKLKALHLPKESHSRRIKNELAKPVSGQKHPTKVLSGTKEKNIERIQDILNENYGPEVQALAGRKAQKIFKRNRRQLIAEMLYPEPIVRLGHQTIYPVGASTIDQIAEGIKKNLTPSFEELFDVEFHEDKVEQFVDKMLAESLNASSAILSAFQTSLTEKNDQIRILKDQLSRPQRIEKLKTDIQKQKEKVTSLNGELDSVNTALRQQKEAAAQFAPKNVVLVPDAQEYFIEDYFALPNILKTTEQAPVSAKMTFEPPKFHDIHHDIVREKSDKHGLHKPEEDVLATIDSAHRLVMELAAKVLDRSPGSSPKAIEVPVAVPAS